MDAWTRIEEAHAQPMAAARAWKAAGGRVAGYLSNTVPRELLAAAGFMPVQLAGDAAEPTPLADRYMEDLFDPIVRSVFQRLLAGAYGEIDVLVLPRTSDSVQRLYYYLCEVRRLGAAELPPVLLFDLLHTPWRSSAEHNHVRALELKAELERVAGSPVAQAALAAEIAAANRRRAVLRRVVALRRARPAQIRGERALQAFAVFHTLDGESFDAAMADALGQPPPPMAEGPRVVVAGSPLDNPALHRLIERLGATVVGDHHAHGEPMIGPDVAEGGDPMAALVAHYHHGVPSSRTFPTNTDELVAFAQAAGADGVVFYFYAEEEALTWEYPRQRRALEAAGIGVIGFSLQPYRLDPAPIEAPLSGFLRALGPSPAVNHG